MRFHQKRASSAAPRLGTVLATALTAVLATASGALAATAIDGQPPMSRPGLSATTEALVAEASRARRQGQTRQALVLYARVLDAEPDSRIAHYNMGILLENAGAHERAVSIWMHAMEVDGGDLFAYEHLVRGLAATGHLDELIDAETTLLAEHPEAEVRRLRLALALLGAARAQAAVPHLERVLVDHPASNIAYTILKDAFTSRAGWLAYVEDIGRRAKEPGAEPNLGLLHIRLLLERGRVAEADALAETVAARSDIARTLLAGVGLLVDGAADETDVFRGVPVAGGDEARVAVADTASKTPVPGEVLAGDEGIVTLAPPPARRETPPDFGPDDPRSAALYIERSQAALAQRDDDDAATELRRVLHASPLRLQPRMTLALLLEQEGRAVEARDILRGAVAVSPWDLYQQVWRTVRDEFHDPDHNGLDLYLWRERAHTSVRTVEDARRAIVALLSVLGDSYGRLFTPEVFARYLLAPNSTPPSGAAAIAASRARERPWVDIAPEVFDAPVPGDEMARADAEGGASRGAADNAVADTDGPGAAATPGSADGAAARDDAGHRGSREASQSDRSATLRVRPRPASAAATSSAAAYYAQDPRVRSAQFPLATIVGATVPDPQARIGYISVPSLAALDVARQVEQALSHMPDRVGLILDLRQNRGGDAAQTVEVAAQFLPAESLVATYLTRRGGQLQITHSEGPHRTAAPIAVLIDGVTASAAEILAAALRDSVGAVLIGERSAGKGVGQKAVLLPDGSGLSLTRFELRSPSGERWDGSGLTPDVAIDPAAGTDPIRAAATELMRLLDEAS